MYIYINEISFMKKIVTSMEGFLKFIFWQ